MRRNKERQVEVCQVTHGLGDDRVVLAREVEALKARLALLKPWSVVDASAGFRPWAGRRRMRRKSKSAVRVAREALAAGRAALPEYGKGSGR